MSELNSTKPLSQPEPVSGVSPALAGMEHRTVIRLGTIALPPDQPAAQFEDEAVNDVPAADPLPDRAPGSVGPRPRPFVKVVADGVIATAWAGLRGVAAYPRSSLAAGLSIVILGATAVTQPRNRTPEARIPSSPAAAPSPAEKQGREANEAAKSDERVIAKDQRDPKATSKPDVGQAKERADLRVSAANLDSAASPNQPAEVTVGRQAPSVPPNTGVSTDPGLDAREPSPAPRPVAPRGDTPLLPSPLPDPAPAPSRSTTSTPLPPSPAEPAPSAVALDSARTDSLPEVPPSAPPTTAATPTLPATPATEPVPLPVVGIPKPTATVNQIESSLKPAPPVESARDPSHPNRDPVKNVQV